MTPDRRGRATGVRLTYPEVPARVRHWVEEVLGSPVVTTAEQVGGMSPGCATRLRCADGTPAFVKAVGPELNPDTPTLFRREAEVLRHLGAHPLWAGLLDVYDETDGWVALLVEDVEGGHPDLSDDATMDGLCRATDRLAQVLAERAPDPGAPVTERLQRLPKRYLHWAGSYDHLDDLPAAMVPAPVRRHADRLQSELRALAAAGGDALVHWDVRDDNLLQRPDGSIVFVDWGQAALGAAWSDPLLARLERVDQPWFDDAVRRSPVLRSLGDDAVTAWLCGFGIFLAHRSVTAVDVNLPWLREFRAKESARVLRGAERRLGG